MSKEVEVIIKTPEELVYWSDEEEGYVEKFPSGLYVIDALGNYHFYMTRDRLKAQQIADLNFGKGKYTVRTTSDKKTKSRQENGLCTAYGTTSRRGTGSWLRKTV